MKRWLSTKESTLEDLAALAAIEATADEPVRDYDDFLAELLLSKSRNRVFRYATRLARFFRF